MTARIFLGVLIGACIGAVLGYFGKCSSGTCPLTANPYRGAIYGAVMGFLITFASSRTPEREAEKPKQKKVEASAPSDQANQEILHIESESDYKRCVLEAKGICLVDLFSNRCPPCRTLAPTISSLARRYTGKVTVCKVHVDRVPSVAQRYRIRAIPTVLLIKNGREVDRCVGLRPEREYAALLDELLGEDNKQ